MITCLFSIYKMPKNNSREFTKLMPTFIPNGFLG